MFVFQSVRRELFFKIFLASPPTLEAALLSLVTPCDGAVGIRLTGSQEEAGWQSRAGANRDCCAEGGAAERRVLASGWRAAGTRLSATARGGDVPNSGEREVDPEREEYNPSGQGRENRDGDLSRSAVYCGEAWSM